MQFITRITLFFLLIQPFYTNAQRSFIRHYGTSDSEYGTALTLTGGSGVLMGHTVSDNGKVYFGLTKTDPNGQLVWSHNYMNRNINVIRAIKNLSAGFIVLGSSSNTGIDSFRIELMHVNSNGNIVWAKEFSTGNSDLATGLSIYNNEIILTGIAEYNVSPKLLWMKTDVNGNLLDSKIWSAPTGISPMSLATNSGGKTGIVCQSNSFGIGTPASLNVIAIQLDANGNIDWSKSLGTLNDDEANSITSDNADWLITGRSYFLSTEWDMSFYKVNASGNLDWGNYYNAGTGDGEAGRSVITNSNQYLIAGDAGTFSERNMNLTSLNNTGDVNWSMEYPISVLYTNYPYEVIALSNDSGYLMTGDLRPSTASRDAALIRTDFAGSAGCFTTNVAMNKLNVTIEDISVSLIPVTFTLTDSAKTWQEMNIVVAETKICAAPDADFSFEKDTTACPDYCFTFTDESVNATTWDWTFTNATPSTYSGQNPPLVCFDTTGTFQVKLIVSDGVLIDSIKKDVVITDYCNKKDSDIVIPNVITPNGDYRNDQFEIKNLPDNFKLVIYNRWGNEIFVSTDKTKMWPEKPGTDKVTEGVYFYVLQVLEPDKKQEFRGNFSVLNGIN